MADAKYIRIPNFGANGTISNYSIGYAYPPMECFNPKHPTHIIYMAVCTIAILCFYPLATLLAPNFQFNNKHRERQAVQTLNCGQTLTGEIQVNW